MNILVLNKNIVVSKLISLSIEEFDANITEVESLSQIKKYNYDVIFIDDSCYNSNLVDFINDIEAQAKILLYSNNHDSFQELDFHFKIKKPFLPSVIIDILNEITVEDTEKLLETNDLSILLDYDDEKVTPLIKESGTNQVDNIKDLLIGDDNMDEVMFNNEEINNDLNGNELNGNELFDLLLDTKVETLKQIFSGAEITINIKFPKDNV